MSKPPGADCSSTKTPQANNSTTYSYCYNVLTSLTADGFDPALLVSGAAQDQEDPETVDAAPQKKKRLKGSRINYGCIMIKFGDKPPTQHPLGKDPPADKSQTKQRKSKEMFSKIKAILAVYPVITKVSFLVILVFDVEGCLCVELT